MSKFAITANRTTRTVEIVQAVPAGTLTEDVTITVSSVGSPALRSVVHSNHSKVNVQALPNHDEYVVRRELRVVGEETERNTEHVTFAEPAPEVKTPTKEKKK